MTSEKNQIRSQGTALLYIIAYHLRPRAHWPLCLAAGGRVFVAGIFIPVGNHYFQALASTLQFVAQVCDRLWLVPATDRAFLWLRSAASTLAIVRVAATQ